MFSVIIMANAFLVRLSNSNEIIIALYILYCYTIVKTNVWYYISEGQKKAQYEECEEERKKNNEKIQILKRDIKEVYRIKRQEFTVSPTKGIRICFYKKTKTQVN